MYVQLTAAEKHDVIVGIVSNRSCGVTVAAFAADVELGLSTVRFSWKIRLDSLRPTLPPDDLDISSIIIVVIDISSKTESC